MWIAGLWEQSPEHGLCYTMVTTDPNAVAATVHDRMPAILESHELEDWLAGRLRNFHPPAESLRVDDAANPLKKGWSAEGDSSLDCAEDDFPDLLKGLDKAPEQGP